MHLVEITWGCASANFNIFYIFRNSVLYHLLASLSLPSNLRGLLLFPWGRFSWGWSPAVLQPLSPFPHGSPDFLLFFFLSACEVKFIVVAVSWLYYKHLALFSVLAEGYDVAESWRNKAAIFFPTGNWKCPNTSLPIGDSRIAWKCKQTEPWDLKVDRCQQAE